MHTESNELRQLVETGLTETGQELKSIRTAILEGRFKVAEQALLKILVVPQREDLQEQAWRWLALVYLYSAQNDLANIVCRYLIQQYPHSLTAWNLAGYILWEEHDYHSAVQCYQQVLGRGHTAWAANGLIAWSFSHGQWAKTLKLWREAGQAKVPRNLWFTLYFGLNMIRSNLALSLPILLGPAILISHFSDSPWAPGLYSFGFIVLVYILWSLSYWREKQIGKRQSDPWVANRKRQNSQYLVYVNKLTLEEERKT